MCALDVIFIYIWKCAFYVLSICIMIKLSTCFFL